MKLSSLFVGAISAIAVIAIVLLIAGVHFERPLAVQGAALYNPSEEITVSGVISDVQEYACPVSEGEMGEHLALKTPDSTMQVHLAPGRIMRSLKIGFAAGDKLTIVGAKFRFHGKDDLIAREITRGNENFVFRDHEGKLMLAQ